jgi:hypothetical protein
MKAVIAEGNKEATMLKEDGTYFKLYHSEGKVEDLVAIFMAPISCPATITHEAFERSFENTMEIFVETGKKVA